MFLIPYVFAYVIATTTITTNEQALAFASSTFAGTPLMEITYCESHWTHWAKNGDVLQGIVNHKDRGFGQINSYYHKEAADKLGYDLETAEGNILYTRWLYDKEGSQPWSASRKCWDK